MIYKKLFSAANEVSPALVAALLVTLTGCVGHFQGPDVAVSAQPTVFVAQDDYVFYPRYGVYYSSNLHQYAYMNGGAWVSRGAPPGVSVSVLLASPSVRMNFHDSPANHHAQMVQKYPQNWKPAAHRAKPVAKTEQHDERGENSGK